MLANIGIENIYFSNSTSLITAITTFGDVFAASTTDWVNSLTFMKYLDALEDFLLAKAGLQLPKSLPYSTLSNPTQRPSLCQTRRGTRQRWFLFSSNLHFKKFEIKNLSRSIFLICFDYIKNNSYINLGDWIHIRIVWSCSNAVKMHNVNIFHKNFANRKTSCQNLNKI